MNRFVHLIKQHQLTLSAAGSVFILLCTITYAVWSTYLNWTLVHIPLPDIKVSQSIHEQQEWLKKIEALPSQNLFGKSPETTPSTLIPISSLQIKITGIAKVSGADSEQLSSVLMSVSGQSAKVYRINDEIASGVKIEDITEDAVIFNRQGQLEKILLPRAQLEFKPKPQSRLSS